MKIRMYLSLSNDFEIWDDDSGLMYIGYPEWWLNKTVQNSNNASK